MLVRAWGRTMYPAANMASVCAETQQAHETHVLLLHVALMLCLLVDLLNLCLEAAMMMSWIGHAAVLVGRVTHSSQHEAW